MNKKSWHTIIWIITILVIILSIWSIVNYKFLKNELENSVESFGYIAIFIIAFIFESIPSLIGPDTPLITGILIGLDFKLILIILILSTTLSSLLSYYLGHKSHEYIKEVSDKKTFNKYNKLFKKYGKAGMIIAAISPIPYVPALAGIFKMNFKYFLFVVTVIREIKYIFIALFLYYILGFI